jgi:NADP-dependent 3-hydroxy acid dehydrogenase YdfG
VAVVTGASAGIGAAIARELAAAGARLLLVARRPNRLAQIAEELGGNVAVLAADVSDREVARQILAMACDRFGGADILVNNAGILRTGSLDQFDLDAIEPMAAINFAAPVRLSYVFARAMKAAASGMIVNVSSIGAHITVPGIGVYSGLKSALEAFTNTLRLELAGSGVRVGLVAPGTTSTEIFGDLKARGEQGWDEYLEPLQPADVARGVRFMLEQPPHANVSHLHIYASAEVV